MAANYNTDENGWVVFGKDDLAKAEVSATQFFNRTSPDNAPMELRDEAPAGDYRFLLHGAEEENQQG